MARSAILNVMVPVAEKAGRALLRDFGEVEQLQVSKKGPNDFVSSADKKAEKIIREELQKSYPDYSFLMEESGKISGADKDNVWIVDPLDGTLNFLHGMPHWCISIALQYKGEVVAAVIHDPVKRETFTAEKGRGAFSDNKRLRVSGRQTLVEALISTPDDDIKAKLVTTRETKNRNMGCTALSIAYVAAGRFEAYCDTYSQSWDKAAGALIVKEAGGFVSELNGGTDAVHGKGIIAANANLRELILQLLGSDPAAKPTKPNVNKNTLG